LKQQIEELKERYNKCDKCTNCLREQKVYGSGNLKADICVIGEGPGEQECRKGIPFVGPAGMLLDKILLAAGIKREDIYLTNAIICRTDTKNRTPSLKEISNCKLRLTEELSIVNPKISILAGSVALTSIFGTDYKIMKNRGQWITNLTPPCYIYYPILHPSWVLHASTESESKYKRKEMWKDVKKLRDELPTILGAGEKCV